MKKINTNDLVKKAFKERNFSILHKLILAFLTPVFLIIVLGIISYTKASQGLISNYEKATDNNFRMATNNLQYLFENVDSLAIDYAENNELIYFTRGLIHIDKQERLSYVTSINNELLKKVDVERYVNNVHIISKEGIPVITSSINNLTGFYDDIIKNAEGAKLENEEGKGYFVGNHQIIDNKLGIDSNDYSMSYLRKINGSEAAISIDIDKNDLNEFLQGLDLGKGSIAGLVLEDGTEILLEDESNIMNNFKFTDSEYYTKGVNSELERNYEYVKLNSQDYLFIYSKVGDSNITICGLIPKASFMSQANDIKNTTIIVVVLASAIAVGIGYIIASSIGKSMSTIISKLRQVSEGDLTVEISVKAKDEFGKLAQNISEMLNNMKSLIKEMSKASELVSGSATEVINSTNMLAQSNTKISLSVGDIGEGINAQATDSQNCLILMDELSSKISIVGNSLDEIQGSMSLMEDMINNGISTINHLKDKSEDTNRITSYVVSNIKLLDEKAQAIEDIINVMNDISEQTNLLSLNASIEAARAGEAGRGFAVVAAEIRNLANKSMISANEVREVIDEITKQTNDTVKTAKEAEEVVNNQNEIVDETMKAFKGINNSLINFMKNLDNIENNVKNMEDSRRGTLEAIENISAISEETAAASGTIDEIIYSQEGHVKNLEVSAESMNNSSKELKRTIELFKI